MSNIEKHDPNMELTEKINWSKAMSTGSLLPRQYQNNPANLMFAAEYADALGVSRIHVLTSIAVINGRPSPSADLMGAMVRNKGHKLRVTGDDTYAEAILIRADDPDYEFKARWDIDKARTAGLWGNKGPWTNYPGAMLRARAISEVVRMGASDVMAGAIYTPEELGEVVDESGNPIRQQATRQDNHQPPQQGQAPSGRDRLAAQIPQQPAQPAGRSADDIRADFHAVREETGAYDAVGQLYNEAQAAGHAELAEELNQWAIEYQELAQAHTNHAEQSTEPAQALTPEAVQEALDAEPVNQ